MSSIVLWARPGDDAPTAIVIATTAAATGGAISGGGGGGGGEGGGSTPTDTVKDAAADADAVAVVVLSELRSAAAAWDSGLRGWEVPVRVLLDKVGRWAGGQVCRWAGWQVGIVCAQLRQAQRSRLYVGAAAVGPPTHPPVPPIWFVLWYYRWQQGYSHVSAHQW